MIRWHAVLPEGSGLISMQYIPEILTIELNPAAGQGVSEVPMLMKGRMNAVC
ncbi:hypothetical protein [Chlorobium phaeobacteroides]|uniref:hypothetical protein n=1 Tax=Chlorobium phaeobacteroides TaxID=1096 RepID=UPI0002F38948|nr:hypothetical protein [Chlorobium phaeobacteroides]